MKAYADTGWLCSLYSVDANTDRVLPWMKRNSNALPWTWIHQLEFRNAMRLRVFLREISVAERDASINAMMSDLSAGVLKAADPPLGQVLTEAERLSANHSAKIGTRSLDILHVASAVVLGFGELLTFDKRQASLAKSVGLKVSTG